MARKGNWLARLLKRLNDYLLTRFPNVAAEAEAELRRRGKTQEAERVARVRGIHLVLSIATSEISPDTDPIMDLLPILQERGFTLVANGTEDRERFLVMKFPEG